nr:hypothetical protein [uncultured Lacibacter sp.]
MFYIVTLLAMLGCVKNKPEQPAQPQPQPPVVIIPAAPLRTVHVSTASQLKIALLAA